MEEKLPGTAPTAGPQAATHLASMESLYRQVAKRPPHSNKMNGHLIEYLFHLIKYWYSILVFS